MPRYVGRAAQKLRPGLMIKEVLLGQRPLLTGELVSEAAIVDLFNVYRYAVKQENSLRPADEQIRGCTYASFLKLFKFAQLLRLVEFIREEPMIYPPSEKHLYTVRVRATPTGKKFSAIISTRRIFRLTDIGVDDEKSWSNLCKAWIEGWTAPQPLEEPIPMKGTLPKKKTRRKKVKEVAEEPVVIREYKLPPEPIPENINSLLAYLEELQTIGMDNKEVASSVARISDNLYNWVSEADDRREDSVSIGFAAAAKQWEDIRDRLRTIADTLDVGNLDGAIDLLRELSVIVQ